MMGLIFGDEKKHSEKKGWDSWINFQYKTFLFWNYNVWFAFNVTKDSVCELFYTETGLVRPKGSSHGATLSGF